MIELLENFVNIPSITGGERNFAEYLIPVLAERGLSITTQKVDENRFNIFATATPNPKVTFCTHIDTVPPFIPFYSKKGAFYGRGSCDAKGQIVAMLQAIDVLLENNIDDIGILLVVGEEVNSDGAKKAAESSYKTEYIILGEPTDNKLVVGQKGVLVFHGLAEGKAAHSSLPELGDSAVHKMVNFVNRLITTDLGEDKFFGKNLVNVGKMSGGVGMNVLADKAEIDGIFRVATSNEEMKKKLEEINQENIKIEYLSDSKPQKFAHLDGFETSVVGFGTDAAYLKPLGQVFLLGPGSITNAHQDNEHITLEDLEKAVDLYVKMAIQLVNGAQK